jgi:hypothetical protein
VNALQPELAGITDAFVVNISFLPPKITGASVSGKTLLVFGENFDNAAAILVDGKEQKTKNDDRNATMMLIGKKAGKKVKPDRPVIIQVRNSDGAVSDEFPFTRPAR